MGCLSLGVRALRDGSRPSGASVMGLCTTRSPGAGALRHAIDVPCVAPLVCRSSGETMMQLPNPKRRHRARKQNSADGGKKGERYPLGLSRQP
jgi:hypothetical protein